MRTQLKRALGVFGAVLAVGACAIAMQDSVKRGANAPDFSAAGTDGKTHTLDSLTKDGPVFLYFIKIGCPVNHRAAPFITEIEKAYGEKGNVVGVINGSVADGRQWAARYGAKYPILADPKLSIIRSYGAPHSPFVIAVGKDGKVSQVLDGLTAANLQSLNGSVATSLKAKSANLDFKGAPSGGG